MARKITADEPSDAFYWSTIAYTKWWLGTDASIISMIAANDGRLNLQTVSSISVPYNVARGLPKQKDDRRNSTLLSVLNERVMDWPVGLVERAAHCVETVVYLGETGCLRNHQASAVSKLVWFLRPDDWTMFDRYAADGMGVPQRPSSTDRLMLFYRSLKSAGFDDLNQLIGQHVQASQWRSVPSSRVIDTFLMRRGGQVDGPYSVQSLSAFLSALPEQASLSLHDLGTAIQKVAGRNPL